jgi:hypothetical protein
MKESTSSRQFKPRPEPMNVQFRANFAHGDSCSSKADLSQYRRRLVGCLAWMTVSAGHGARCQQADRFLENEKFTRLFSQVQ